MLDRLSRQLKFKTSRKKFISSSSLERAAILVLLRYTSFKKYIVKYSSFWSLNVAHDGLLVDLAIFVVVEFL